jgi:Golgi SNAP receptor complex protein 2
VVAADFSGVAAASAKAELWRKRAAQLSAEADALRAAVARYLQSSFLVARARAEREARHRLFDGAGGGGAGGGAAVAVDALLAERASAGSSARMLDEYLATAGGVLGALKAQRATFKGAHKRALDVAASLGLSSSLLRLIERRTTADKILVYGGMALICVLVGLVLLWLQRG